MKWRKWNRWLHREIGYLFFGMSIVYGISGIALNHHIARHWNPSLVEHSEKIGGIGIISREDVSRDYIEDILELTQQRKNYKEYFFSGESNLMIYLNGGHISVDISTGEALLVKVRNRRVFREMNFLHYNKPKKLWTYFADFFGFAMVALAVTGLFMVKGKKGITGQGAFLVAAGILIPLLFLVLYLWT